MRDSTIFYRSFYEAVCNLEPQVQVQVYNAIFEYSLNFNEIKLDGIAKTIFTLIKPQIDANIKRYKNGNEPKTKQKGSETEAKPKQKISKTEANDNVNDNVNENKKERTARKVSFEKSDLFDKNIFAAKFEGWNKEKLKHYYDAAERYSGEGNKYVNWYKAILSWEARDKLAGKIKFDPILNTSSDRYKV